MTTGEESDLRGTSVDLSYDADDADFAGTLRDWASGRDLRDGRDDDGFARKTWGELADLGVLGLATPDGGGGAQTIAAAMEELGAAGCPGPLPATFVATRLLEATELDAVARGTSVVSLSDGGLVPWGTVADIHLVLDAGQAWRAVPDDDHGVAVVNTLDGERWARMRLTRQAPLGVAAGAVDLGHVAAAAYLAALGRRAVSLAAGYAGVRVQFGRPIGSFQAVAHPLADAITRLRAAAVLARRAAYDWDRDAVSPLAHVARASAAAAAVDATLASHQVLGAYGFTTEAPLAALSFRARQLSVTPPTPLPPDPADLLGLG